MDFVFAEKFEADQLLQGDLLIRNASLTAVLGEAHQYYADAPSYTHFVVVTQSCDLVRRKRKPPKASYITIAAVRPFQIVLERFLAKFEHEFEGRKTQLFDAKYRRDAEQFLERMLNNEEKGYFFFRAGSHPSIREDLCAFLALSVALRASHYDALLSAKVAQLDDVFAAKLGSIVSELYSRIATPDISERLASPEEYKRNFYEEKLGVDGSWISTTRWSEARGALKQQFRGRLEHVGAQEAALAVAQIQDDMGLLADRAIELTKTATSNFVDERVLKATIAAELAKGPEKLEERLFELILSACKSDQVDEQALKNLLSNDARLRRIARAIAG